MNDKSMALTPLPEGYTDWLAELKTKIHNAQQRATRAVNQQLIALYWHVGRGILERQATQGWGAKVIERLAHDLRTAFPDMKGFSPRNLKYMRAFAAAWSDAEFVQAVLAQLPWYRHLALLDKLSSQDARRWYAAKAIAQNWSRNVLVMQIETNLQERSGTAVTNFEATIGLLLCKGKNKVVAEYALGDKTQPKGIAEYKLAQALPETLATNLPSIEQIERELQGEDQ